MRAPNGSTLLALFAGLVLALAAAPAPGAVETQADTAIQLYCSSADGSAHPRQIGLTQILSADAIDSLQDGRLLVGYDRDGDDTGKGKITVVGRLQRTAGSSRKLPKVSASLNRVTGETVGAAEANLELEEGDAILWTFKFKKSARLDAGQCATLIAGVTRPSEGCGPYVQPATSPYSLPFLPGQESVMSQGNCSGIGSHRYAARHAYDFALPIGTQVVAIAGGVVQFDDDGSPDGTGLDRDANVVQILHDDGTYVDYVHLAQGSAIVAQGDRVEQGQPIASSGNSGGTGGIPHLHLQLMSCPQRSVCGTLPITFNNTSAHSNGLEVGQLYRAR